MIQKKTKKANNTSLKNALKLIRNYYKNTYSVKNIKKTKKKKIILK